MGLPHAAAKATEATAPEATKAATAAPRGIAGTPYRLRGETRGRDEHEVVTDHTLKA
jgi:hypothetical protein